MQPLQLLHKIFSKEMPGVHKTRLASLMESVKALTNSKKLTLTMLGRHMQTPIKMRSNIKKADRLLGNKHLHVERSSFFKCINTMLISENSKPWLLIDWSCLSSENELYVLRASLSVKGRGIVVYEEVHPKKKENNHTVHKAFLTKLRDVLPASAKPIIVTDAGFRAIWFNEIQKMGWDYVGRLRNKNLVTLFNVDDWKMSKELYLCSSNTPKYLGEGLLTKRTALRCKFIVFKGKKKKRRQYNKNGSECKSTKSKRYSKAQKEPWLLVTSLKTSNTLAKKVVRIYRERMQIEENFRDTKDRRYGFGLNESGTKATERMEILLLVAAIATLLCWVVGVFVKHKNYAANYQAHSAKFTTALSIVYLGCEVLRKPLQMLKKDLLLAIEKIVSISSTETAKLEMLTA